MSQYQNLSLTVISIILDLHLDSLSIHNALGHTMTTSLPVPGCYSDIFQLSSLSSGG